MEYFNTIQDNDKHKISGLRYMLADLAAISLGIEEISGHIEDAIGE